MPKTRPPGVAAAGRRLRLIAGGAEPLPEPSPSPPFPFPADPAPYPPPEPGRPKPPPSIGARWAGIGVARARAGFPFRVIQRPAAGGDWTADAASYLTRHAAAAVAERSGGRR